MQVRQKVAKVRHTTNFGARPENYFIIRLEGWLEVLVHQNACQLEKVIPVSFLRADS
jgi:hypothetical protein